jgi:hypothetical protein
MDENAKNTEVIIVDARTGSLIIAPDRFQASLQRAMDRALKTPAERLRDAVKWIVGG